MSNYALDLKTRPPRSPRVRLGGYVILPRMLDKCRAELAGTEGEYHFACPLDQRFLTYVGIDAEKLKAEVAKGVGDWQILQWIEENAATKRHPAEVAQWSAYCASQAPSDAESQEFFTGELKRCGAAREDVSTWFDLLDLDDYVSYGGTA